MQYPKISIVTSNFNGDKYLERTILSIISQKYPNLDYIIVDGGSTDGSIDIINKYKKHLTYWISEPDKGLYDALNKGFKKSSGEIMGWLNGDDILYPNSLFTLADIFYNNTSVEWFTGIQSVIDKEDRIIETIPARKWSKYNFYLKDFFTIQQESTFWRRSLWTKAGEYLSSTYKYAGDLELWSRFFYYSKLYSGNIPIGCFRTRPGEQISSVYKNDYLSECEEILDSMVRNCSENAILKKIEFYRKYRMLLKSDSVNNHYNELFDYPNFITYNVNQNIFEV